MPLKDILGSLDFNVLMMIAGTMGIVGLFIESKMPALLADIIIEKVPNVKWCIVALALFASLISAFVDNVATVLMVAPVAIDVAKKLRISPVPIILSIAVASNLQGGTLSRHDCILLAGTHMSSNFFWYENVRIILRWQFGAMPLPVCCLFETNANELPRSRTLVTEYFRLLIGRNDWLLFCLF